MAIVKNSCALITIDVQNDFTLKGSPAEIPGTTEVVPNIVKLLTDFRRTNSPIVHVVRLYLSDGSNVDLCRREKIRSGLSLVRPETDGAELVAELKPSPEIRLHSKQLLNGDVQQIAPNEFVIYKPRWGAFYDTGLEKLLQTLKVDSLIFCGCNFPNCPRTSIYEASERDFHVALAGDAVSGLYDKGKQELEKIGVSVVSTDKLIESLSQGVLEFSTHARERVS